MKTKKVLLFTRLSAILMAGSLLITGCGGGGGGGGGGGAATLSSIAVTPATPTMAAGATRQFTATGTYSDATTADITASVAWSSSSAGVATINAVGLATGVAAGTTTITATLDVTGSTALTVTAPTSTTTQMGGSRQGVSLNLTTVVTTIAGTAGIFGSTDGTGAAALFKDPFCITTDGTNLYVADNSNYTIRKVVISTGVVTTVAGTAGSAGSTDGTGAAARFNSPFGITTDGTNLYVADFWNHTIRKVVISTGVVTTVAGTALSSGSTDGTGVAAWFNYPAGITTDGTSLYVIDRNNFTIRRIQ